MFVDLYGSFSVKWFFGLLRFLVWSGKAVHRPVACDQVRGARGKVSRDRNASAARGTDADGENGPAARSFAADAHDCIMVRIQTDLPHTSLAARSCAPMASSPRINTPDKRVRRRSSKKPVSGHQPSACSGVKALRKHKRR